MNCHTFGVGSAAAAAGAAEYLPGPETGVFRVSALFFVYRRAGPCAPIRKPHTKSISTGKTLRALKRPEAARGSFSV